MLEIVLELHRNAQGQRTLQLYSPMGACKHVILKKLQGV